MRDLAEMTIFAFRQSLLVVLSATLAASVHAQSAPALPQAVLGTPPDGSTVSGVGVISGYHCQASSNNGKKVEIRVDDLALGAAGTGTTLLGTHTVCGHTDTGYSMLYNFNNLAEGEHKITAVFDGIPFATNRVHTVRSTGVLWRTLGEQSPWITVPDFPEPGQYSTIVWKDELQGFVVSDMVDSTSCTVPSEWQLELLRCVYPANVEVLPSVFDDTKDFFAFIRTGGIRYVASNAMDSTTNAPAFFGIYQRFTPANSGGGFGYSQPDRYWLQITVLGTSPFALIDETYVDGQVAWAKGTTRGLLVRMVGEQPKCVEITQTGSTSEWSASPTPCE